MIILGGFQLQEHSASVSSVEKIVEAGSWRSSSTFAKKYLVQNTPGPRPKAVLARTRC